MNIVNLNKELKSKKYIVWGARNIGLSMVDYLLNEGVEVAFICDRESKFWACSYRGIDIISPQDLFLRGGIEEYNIVIGSTRKATIAEIENMLIERGVSREQIFDLSEMVFLCVDNWCNKEKRVVKKYLAIQTHITEHCNLNCRGCDHFSPVAKEAYVELNEYKKDIMRLRELFEERFVFMSIMGGEPLLHPQIEEILKISRECLPMVRLVILTNGILLKNMPDSFWVTCKKYDIEINLTMYPVNFPYEWAEKKAKEYGIKYEYTNEEPIKTLWKSPLDISGNMNKEEMFEVCGESNFCISLRQGKLYTCSVAAYVHHFESYFGIDLPYAKENGIDIYEAKTADEIMEFLATPIDMCRHCDIKGRTYNNPWGQSERKMEEWT